MTRSFANWIRENIPEKYIVDDKLIVNKITHCEPLEPPHWWEVSHQNPESRTTQVVLRLRIPQQWHPQLDAGSNHELWASWFEFYTEEIPLK